MKHSIAAIVTVAALATGALVVTSLPSAAADAQVPMATTAAEHEAEAAKYDQEAVELEAKAARHSELAAQYARMSGGKQADAQRSMSNHCERLAKSYRAAAAEARDMAKMHLEMAKAA
jgi:hypothetical protein